MNKNFLICLTFFMVLVSASACAKKKINTGESQGVSDSEIIIGSSSALSGQASFLGSQTIHGSLAYINEVNSKGGVHGRKIRLISYDDQYEPSETVTNTQRLINQDKVFALFDYVGTPTSLEVIDIVHKLGIPLLGLFTGAEDLRVPYRPYIFNVRDSYYVEAEGAVAYFVDKLGLKKIAVMYQKDSFGLAVLSGVQLALKRRNMEPVATAVYTRGSMDVALAMEDIRSSGAEAVIMVGTYAPLAKFIKLSNDAGFKPYFHTVSFVGSEAFVKELVEVQKINPGQYDKIIITQVVPSPYSEDLPGVKEYRELVKKYYPNDKPNFVALEGFINAKILVKALEDAGRDLTKERFIEALESIYNFDVGIGKVVSYTMLNHQGLKGIYYSKPTKEGTFITFNP